MRGLLNKRIYVFVLFCFISARLCAVDRFVIEDIRLEGLERITPGTVFNYLPIRVGDMFDDARSKEAVSALFKTGFFDDVRIERDGQILVLLFKERPAIVSIQFTGNEDIKTDDLIDSLRQFGFAEGRVFVQAKLEQVKQELQSQYYSFGKYATTINSTVTDLGQNRVAILIEVSEGLPAKIKSINIVGNTIFNEATLLDEFTLKTKTLFSFFSKNDQYSRQKLAGDIAKLRSYYLDRGYLNFSINSTQVSITPDKSDIYLTINITEGSQYQVNRIQFAGDLILPEEALSDILFIASGDLFSEKNLTDSRQSLIDRLGEEGYAFANVNAIPDINQQDKTVSLTFFIDPGKRVYVRRINFSGNSKTKDEVLRREMRQQEGAWISTAQIERGKQRLQRTGYFRDVNVETPAVPGTTDQVDVLYSVEEAPGGRLSAGLGFSPGQGLIFNTSVIQDNFLGTGKRISFDFNNSRVNTRYGFGYQNPYFTIDGISQGFNVFYRETDAVDANLAVYETRDVGADINFGYPVTENNSISFAMEYRNTKINLLDSSGIQIRDFIEQNGDQYDIFSLQTSFSYNTTNRYILPDKGMLHRIHAEFSIPTFGDSLQYYKMNYQAKWFKNIYRDFILSLGGELGYGDGYGDTSALPFFENFFAGGPRTVRGFKTNTLGPRDSTDRPLGGSTKILSKAEVILPIPFLSDFKKSVRVSAFIDGGNVYGVDEGIDLDQMRYSTGIGAIWISPIGAVSVSFAFPLNDESTDEIENFQFTLGTSF